MPLFDLFWAMLWFFLFVAWLWVLWSVIIDIFRSSDMGGWAKALWVLFVAIIPWLGVLAYVLARGDKMAQRTENDRRASEEAARAYIRDAAGGVSAADELTKLARLRDDGILTHDEFALQKAKLLA